MMKKSWIKIFTFCIIFCFSAFAFSQEKFLRIDLETYPGIGYMILHEYVYPKKKVSDLVWTQAPFYSINANINVTLKQGFTFLAGISFLPSEQKMFLTDSDFYNGFRWSYSEHPVSSLDSLLASLGLGWKFFVKTFQCKKYTNRLFIEPFLLCDLYLFNFNAYDGKKEWFPEYRKNGNKEERRYYSFNGSVIDYKLRLFSSQVLLNFYGELAKNVEMKAGLGIGLYSNALVYDHHIPNKVKYYDIFNFYIFICSLQFKVKYLLARGFGIFGASDFTYCYSTYGKTIVYSYVEEKVKNLSYGASGIKFMRFNFSLGFIWRLSF